MEKLVVYGGSFDPVHNGHLRIASAASLFLNADVVFVPAKAPRWKSPDATPEERLAMLKLALKEKGNASFSIDTVELKSPGDVTYTIDTARYFKKKYPNRELYLLLGADEVNLFPKWKDAEELAKLMTPLYVTRPGVRLDDAILTKYQMRRLPFDESGPVSSSAVRELQDIDIPLSVRDYIEKKRLYYFKKLEKMESGHRLLHSISVANLAYMIAHKNHVEGYHRAYIAGLLHDVAKDLPMEELKKIMKEHYPDAVAYPEWCYHQFVGAYLAEKEFGIKDPVVLDAISFHATGKPHMSPLAKIIYASDKIEPTRGYDSKFMIDACLRNYYVGFLTVLEENRKFLKGQGYGSDDPLSKACMNLYLGEE